MRHLSHNAVWGYRKLSLLCPHPPAKKGISRALQGKERSASFRPIGGYRAKGVSRKAGIETSLPSFISGRTIASPWRPCFDWESAAVEEGFRRDSVMFDR